jgi:hypothetical protein
MREATQRARRIARSFACVAAIAAVVAGAGCDRGTAGSGGAATAPAAQAPAASTQADSPAPTPAAPAATTELAGGQVDAPPPITLDPPVLDFGIVPPSVTKEGVVKLINTGTRELEVLAVEPDCKCTTLEDVSGQKIPVGGYLEIRTSMKAASAPGGKRASLKVFIDGYSQLITIPLRNEVSLPVRISPAYLNVVRDQPKTGKIVIESIDGEPFRVCSVGGKAPNLVGFDPAKDEPRNQYVLEWDFNRDFEPNKAPRYWIIETDRADSPLVDVFVRHETTMPRPVLKMTDYRHTFGRMEQGTSVEFVVELNELPEGERIAAAASSVPEAKVELLKTETVGKTTSMTLRVTPAAGVEGILYVPFSIYTNLRSQELTVWGQVVPAGTQGCFGK